MTTFPALDQLTICFAHPAYQMAAAFEKLEIETTFFQVWNPDDLDQRIDEAHVLVISGLWHNGLLDQARNLRYIQSIGAGYDQFPLEILPSRNIRLANARGVNRNAVSEHAIGLMLALTRQIHYARDQQQRAHWRELISDLARREDEIAGKTILIVGLGGIGGRIARLAKAFETTVIGTKRNPATAPGDLDAVYPALALPELLPQADCVILACPLTPETHHLINAETLARMKPTAILINVGRGPLVDESALIAALQIGTISGAGLDVFESEPLEQDSPLWKMDNVLITPHTAGETRQYEENVIDILVENLHRLAQGQTELRNQII
jgi:phosphoglycerate dehydrogenase-like enzyme